MLKTVVPGIHSWETKDVKRFRAFAVVDGGEVALIDPVPLDDAEAKAIEALGKVVAVLLTSEWHEREAAAVAQRYGVPVYAHPEALGVLACKTAQPLPETLPVGLQAWHIPGAFAGQVAYYWPREGGILIVGDCWMNIPMGELPLPIRLFMKFLTPLRDGLHLLPPKAAKDSQAVIAAYRRHLEQPVARLLVSHGKHLHEGAREKMLARLDQGP